MEKGIPGERYILGGENISYNQFFSFVQGESGVRKKLFKIPLWTMLTAAGIMLGISKITGKAPLIVPNLTRKFNHNWIVSSEKAIRELGYQPRNAQEGIQQTVQWIKNL